MDVNQGVVLYTDGGCEPNPGFAGWGVHGYLFSLEKPKKGSGMGTHLPTNHGYMLKADFEDQMQDQTSDSTLQEITPISYIDGYGSFDRFVTNNVAELVAATRAMQFASDLKINTCTLFLDSEYVRVGLTEWVEHWKRNNWLKRDGREPANIGYWKDLIAAKELLESHGVEVDLHWIRGHSGDPGNEAADQLATLGQMVSKSKKLINQFNKTPPEGYWKTEVDKHPFISFRRMFFNTDRAYFVPGEYYLGNQATKSAVDSSIGTRASENGYSVIQLQKTDPVLEIVRDYATEMAEKTDFTNTLMTALLDKIFRCDTYKQILEHAGMAMIPVTPHRLDFQALDREPILRELRPPKIADRAVIAMENIREKLQDYLDKKEYLVVTDLTPILYDTKIKKDKKGNETVECKLNAKYKVGFASLTVDAKYEDNGEIKVAPVILTLGIDMLDRNALKRIEEMNPKVLLITWRESDKTFRYATIVEVNNARGIWCGFDANLRVVTKTGV